MILQGMVPDVICHEPDIQKREKEAAQSRFLFGA
jgi:hypothetical protein